jgi:hypothetical protein
MAVDPFAPTDGTLDESAGAASRFWSLPDLALEM